MRAHLKRAVDLGLGRSELVQSPHRDQPAHLGAPGEGAPVRTFSVGQLRQAVEAGGEAALAALRLRRPLAAPDVERCEGARDRTPQGRQLKL